MTLCKKELLAECHDNAKEAPKKYAGGKKKGKKDGDDEKKDAAPAARSSDTQGGRTSLPGH